MRDELLNDLEGACNFVLQKIRTLRAAKKELAVLKSGGFQYTPSRIRKAEEEVGRLDRVLAKVTDELVEYAMQVTGNHNDNHQQQPAGEGRRASRGD